MVLVHHTGGGPKGRTDYELEMEGERITQHKTNNPNRAATFRNIQDDYGQKLMLPTTHTRRCVDEMKRDLNETLALIQKRRNFDERDGERDFVMPPWGYKRSRAVPLEHSDLSEAREVIGNMIEETHHMLEDLPQTMNADTVKRALDIEILEGIGYMETDKNMGFVCLPIPVILAQYDTEMRKYQVLGTVMEVYDATKARLVDEADSARKHLAKRCKKKGILKDALTYIERHTDQRAMRIPVLRLLVKLHKITAVPHNLQFPTRPIIPACVSPFGGLSAVMGSVLARIQKKIPWIVEDTDDFLLWLRDKKRDVVRTYDFTNLFGTEPVGPTMQLLEELILYKPEWLEDDYVKPFLVVMDTPIELLYILRGRSTLLEVLVAYTLRETVAVITATDGNYVVSTKNFLAMGVGTVAPLSNITLAMCELRALGEARATECLRRLIDDIAADLTLITREELFSIYPSYLTLNDAKDGVYLDVQFRRIAKGHFFTFPNIKSPCADIPAYESVHRNSSKRAIAMNELSRLAKLSSTDEVYRVYRQRHIGRLQKARFPDHIVHQAESVSWFQALCKREQKPDEGVIFRHVTVMHDYDVDVVSMLRKHFPRMHFMTAWKRNQTLVSINKKRFDEFCKLEQDVQASRMCMDLQLARTIAANPQEFQTMFQCTIQNRLLVGLTLLTDHFYNGRNNGTSRAAERYIRDCIQLIDELNRPNTGYPCVPVSYSMANIARMRRTMASMNESKAEDEAHAIHRARLGYRTSRDQLRRRAQGAPRSLLMQLDAVRVTNAEAEQMSQEVRRKIDDFERVRQREVGQLVARLSEHRGGELRIVQAQVVRRSDDNQPTDVRPASDGTNPTTEMVVHTTMTPVSIIIERARRRMLGAVAEAPTFGPIVQAVIQGLESGVTTSGVREQALLEGMAAPPVATFHGHLPQDAYGRGHELNIDGTVQGDRANRRTHVNSEVDFEVRRSATVGSLVERLRVSRMEAENTKAENTTAVRTVSEPTLNPAMRLGLMIVSASTQHNTGGVSPSTDAPSTVVRRAPTPYLEDPLEARDDPLELLRRMDPSFRGGTGH